VGTRSGFFTRGAAIADESCLTGVPPRVFKTVTAKVAYKNIMVS